MAPRSDADDQGFDMENLPPPDDDDYDWADDWDAPLTETHSVRARWANSGRMSELRGSPAAATSTYSCGDST